MKKILLELVTGTVLLCVAGVFICLLLTSCGHNSVIASKGYGIDISWTGESYIPNIRLGYWDNITTVVKENVDVEVASSAGLNASGGTGQSTRTGANAVAGGNAGTTLKLKTGPQTNGYVRDVLTSPTVGKNNTELAKAIYAVRSKMDSKGVQSSSVPNTSVVSANVSPKDIPSVTTPVVVPVAPVVTTTPVVKTVQPTEQPKIETPVVTKSDEPEPKVVTPIKTVDTPKRGWFSTSSIIRLFGIIIVSVLLSGCIIWIMDVISSRKAKSKQQDEDNQLK